MSRSRTWSFGSNKETSHHLTAPSGSRPMPPSRSGRAMPPTSYRGPTAAGPQSLPLTTCESTTTTKSHEPVYVSFPADYPSTKSVRIDPNPQAHPHGKTAHLRFVDYFPQTGSKALIIVDSKGAERACREFGASRICHTDPLAGHKGTPQKNVQQDSRANGGRSRSSSLTRFVDAIKRPLTTGGGRSNSQRRTSSFSQAQNWGRAQSVTRADIEEARRQQKELERKQAHDLQLAMLYKERGQIEEQNWMNLSQGGELERLANVRDLSNPMRVRHTETGPWQSVGGGIRPQTGASTRGRTSERIAVPGPVAQKSVFGPTSYRGPNPAQTQVRRSNSTREGVTGISRHEAVFGAVNQPAELERLARSKTAKVGPGTVDLNKMLPPVPSSGEEYVTRAKRDLACGRKMGRFIEHI